jgi:murein DD-endopeptidase MepM/ murein hydrolase activator NlpD
MKRFTGRNSNTPRWLAALIGVFLVLVAGTAYLVWQIYFAEPEVQTVFPKYSQPKDLATAELEQALQISLQRHPEVLSYLIYRVAITNVVYSDDRNTALLWLALYDKDTDTLIPAEPGLAIGQRGPNNTWTVAVQADDNYNALLNALPSTMIDDETKAQYISAPQALSKAAVPLRGYRLPWQKGVTKFLTGSVGHVLTYKSCPSSCMYAFDFADGGNFPILAAKAGRVKYAVWKYPDNNHQNANYLILEDDATSPVTFQVYFHLSQNSIPDALRVKGAWLNQGQFIGNVDNTGYSSGPHLHFHVHTNATSYWGNSVDIVFEDVAVNGGRPRTCSEAKAFPQYGNQCMPGDKYTSNNGDSKPPSGVMSAPTANTVVTTSTVAVSGYGSDESGVARVQPMVNYDGVWRPAGEAILSSAFIADVDLCAAGVPDGPLSIGLNIWDNGGNQTTSPVAVVNIRKKFTCPVLPPACSPAANQAALYNNAHYQGYCQLVNEGDIADLSTLTDLGIGNLESIQLGAGMGAILYDQTNFTGRTQTLTASSEDLDGQIIGGNHAASLKLLKLIPAPGKPVLGQVTGPGGTALTADDSVTLAWPPVEGALDYRVEVTGPNGYQSAQDWQATVAYSLGSLKAGSYQLTVFARNSAGQSSATGMFAVQPGKSNHADPVNSPYEAAFSGNVAGWTSSGLWQRAGFKTGTENQTGWIFGSDSTYSKDGSRAFGDLTSPAISIGHKGQQFTFRFATGTESGGEVWDQRHVQLSVDGGPFQNIMTVTGKTDGSLTESKPVDLSDYTGKSIRLRFHFDTIDGAYNKGLGWAITAVRISDDPSKVCSEYADDGVPEKARDAAIGGTAEGQFCPAGDTDFYKFTGQKGKSFTASLNIASNTTDVTPVFSLVGVDAKTTVAEGKVNGVTAQLNTKLPEDGVYYLKLGAAVGKSDNPALNYRLSLIQDTTPPTVKLTKPSDGSVSLALPIALAADAADGDKPAARVEFYVQPVGAAPEDTARVSVDETPADGWTGTIPSDFAGKLAGSAVFARAYDQAGNSTDSNAILLAGDGSIPVTHLDALPAENGSTMVTLRWSAVSKSPIDHFELQFKMDGSDWKAWAAPLAGDLRSTGFFANNGSSYEFRIRAVTAAGAEEFPAGAQAKTIVETECTPDKYEPKDNVPTDSPALTAGTGQLHNLCGMKDEDWTSMLLQGGKSYIFTAKPVELAAGVTMQIFDMAGNAMTDAAGPADLNSETKLDFSPDTSATYLLHIKAADEHLAGTHSVYSISYDQAEPFSPIPIVCGAILIPLLTALAKLWGRMRASAGL